MTRRKLEVNLGTEERQEACLQTLQLCVHITRDLIGDAAKMDGPIALAALAAVFDQMIADVILSYNQRRPDSHTKGRITPAR